MILLSTQQNILNTEVCKINNAFYLTKEKYYESYSKNVKLFLDKRSSVSSTNSHNEERHNDKEIQDNIETIEGQQKPKSSTTGALRDFFTSTSVLFTINLSINNKNYYVVRNGILHRVT